MNYIVKQQLKRFLAIVATLLYVGSGLFHAFTLSKLDWILMLLALLAGSVAVLVTTAKIRIVSRHLEKSEGGQR